MTVHFFSHDICEVSCCQGKLCHLWYENLESMLPLPENSAIYLAGVEKRFSAGWKIIQVHKNYVYTVRGLI